MNVGAPAHLQLLDTRSQRATILFPSPTSVVRPAPLHGSRCPGPPDAAALSLDGINLREGKRSQHLLYAANHGDRHAVEIFAIDAAGAVPTAAWIDCVPMPAGTLANAVIPLSDGGLIVTSFHDPDDPQAWARMARGEGTGSVWEWHANQGLRRLDTGDIPGANGLALSADQRTLYVSAWAAGTLLIIDRRTGRRQDIALGFLPDNIKTRSDGSLLIAGQRSSVAAIARCAGPTCPQDWIVARVDPVTTQVTPLLSRAGTAVVDYACGALQVDGTLYVTVRGDHRLVYVPSPRCHRYADPAILQDMKALLLVLASLGFAGCHSLPVAPQAEPHDIHWFRTSAERRAVYEQTFVAAGQAAKLAANGLPARSWGVILDVDETVLDNSAYQRELALSHAPYTPDSWTRWVIRHGATPLPGAAGFTQLIQELQGQVILVTNRLTGLCVDTEENLRDAGIRYDRILCANSEDADKSERFAAVQAGTPGRFPPVQIVLWMGDNIRDFPGLAQGNTDSPSSARAISSCRIRCTARG